MASSELPITIEVMALNDDEVFQYLDAHPDILHRYLTERAGLAESLLRTHGQTQAHDNVATAVQDDGDVPVEHNSAPIEQSPDTVDSVSDLLALSGLSDNETPVDMDEADNDVDGGQREADYGMDEDGNLHGDEVDDWAGPDVNSGHASEEDLGDDEISEVYESQDDLDYNELDSSQGGTASNRHSSSPPPPGLPSTALNPTSSFGERQPTVPNDTTSIPYPAPRNLVTASMSQQKGKKWRLFEEESCIRHMLNIRDEGVVQGEDRFREAQRRMASVDGIHKDAKYAVKNFWNRVGRARSGFDERKNQKAPLATSQQGKTARASSSCSNSTPRKRKNGPKTRKTKRKYESDSEDSGSIPSDPDDSCKPTPKRRNRDEDSDDDWQPDQNTHLNAIAV
ncbi:hypothetical protein PV08_00712 [Exophiala spinifera]|uniref:Uncharacterized protein n=1 Tax=Exophiala spinifera TaxID=91928 RepID=A0A0D2A5T8_9EURO|nr:uncharacterized protein PV08_00712 [Exophiala spinifera]KIW20137.1 hypothetical protein PV08_00712 [Exophiala spinifera]